MANKNNEMQSPSNPFQLSLVSSTSTNSVFASTTQNDAKTETADQPPSTVSGGITSVAAVNVNQLPSTSVTSTLMSSSIFPSVPLQAQGLLGNFSRPFGGPGGGKPETSRVFGSSTTVQPSGTFEPKIETASPFGLLNEEKKGSTVSGGNSNPFSPSNSFSRVSNNDSCTTGTNIFGGTVSSLSAPKLFGGTTDADGGLQLQKTAEAEQSKISIPQVSMPPTVDVVGSFGTYQSQASFTPSLFGGVVSSSSVVSMTEVQPITTSPSIFGGKTVESSHVQTFGGTATFSASVPFGGNIHSKSTVHESKAASSAESVSSSNVFNDSPKQSKPILASTSGPFSTHQELYGTDESHGTITESSGKTHTKSNKKTLFDKHEGNQKSVDVKDHKSYEAALELIPASIIKPEMIPELFEKSEVQESSGTSPEYHKKDLTKIIIALIPDSCMDKEILKRHFEKFGEVKRIMLNSKVNQATVQYNNHHAASKAKKKGNKIHPKLPEVKIFYGTPARRKSEESNSDAMLSKKKAIKTLQQSHQPSDLDPYTPLERPTHETPKPTKHLSNRAKPHKVTHPVVEKISSGKKKQTNPIFPAKADGKHKTLKEFSDPATYRPHEHPTDVISSPKKQFVSRTKPLKTIHLSVDDKSGSSKKQQTRPISPARENKESTISIEGKDLKTILASQTHNNYDKFLILKARDKHLRNERTRTSDLKKAAFLAATCTDMCPEFERYMRDVQNDISSYEMTNGILDPSLAVKKFYRSSADKDVPLPHELRPGPVLLRTMDFLICNVINRGDDDVELDVWYNYLWNRTRAIRNDLMQQQLIDAEAVVIMERCTRFHIYAAVRLCQEPPDLFDAKMNTEHLTKSLQTLKELYHDLGEKEECFDTEAEFRAYEMLLNLNDGETIVTQYSQYREEVQKSSHVQFALKVVLALTTNNYVKFFKLIRGATYLQGCLLHRYFRQVRSKALDTLIKAYVPTKMPQTVPLQTVIKILGFEDESDAVTYLRCHGISVVEQNVVLDRCSFIHHPEEQPPLVRPTKLVEANLTCSVGEVIQGGPIPDNPLHTHIPHSSFDDQGYLKSMAKDASDQKGENRNKTCDVLDSSYVVQQPERQQNYELLVHVKEIYNLIESSVLKEFITQVSTECIEMLRYDLLLEKSVHAIHHEIVEDSVHAEVRNVCYEGITEIKHEQQEILRKKKEEEERQRKCLEELYLSVANGIGKNYICEFVDGFTRQICQETVQEVEIKATFEELMEELPYLCINEIIMEQITRISEEVIKEITEEQQIKIEDFQQKIHVRKMGECFQKWRMQVLKARRKKQSQETFPADSSHFSIMQQNETFGWGYCRSNTENRSALKLLQLESNITRNFEKLDVKNQLVKKCAWYPIYFQCLVMNEEKSLPTRSLVSQYFKVLVCTADSASSTILHWFRSKLGGEENTDVQELLYHCFSFISKTSGTEYAWVLKEGSVSSLSAEDIRGTSAVLFVTSCADKQDPEYCKMQELLMRMPMVSYCTVYYDCQPCDSKGWTLTPEDLLRPETSEKLQSLLLDFWKHQGKQMNLVSAHMNNFVCGFIAKTFLEPALRIQNERIQDGKSPIPPSVQIDLYNKVIDFLIEVIQDEDLQRLNWPPPELSHMRQVPPPTWNSTDAKHVVDILSHLKLPDLCLEGITSWKNITEILHAYATKVSGPYDDGVALVSHLNSLLSGTQKILRPDYEYEDCPEWQLHVLQLPWTELVYACVSYKVSGLNNISVFYQRKKLEHFTFPQSWWTACDTSEPLWLNMKENYPPESRKRKSDEEVQLPSERIKVKKVPSKLLCDLNCEKQRYVEFEKKLESVLESNEELELCF